MNKKLMLASVLSASLLAGCNSSDNQLSQTPVATNNNVTVQVLWNDLDDFKDIDPGVSSKQNFRKQLTRTFESHITNLASQMPDGYKLYFVVEDVDLAGKVSHSYFEGREALRVYDTFFQPQITFTYRVKNPAGEFVAAQDKLKLNNTHTGTFPAAHFMLKPFAYEKYMLKSWFDHVLIPHVNEKP